MTHTQATDAEAGAAHGASPFARENGLELLEACGPDAIAGARHLNLALEDSERPHTTRRQGDRAPIVLRVEVRYSLTPWHTIGVVNGSIAPPTPSALGRTREHALRQAICIFVRLCQLGHNALREPFSDPPSAWQRLPT